MRGFLIGGWLGAFVGVASIRGVPLDRNQVLLWILSALVIAVIVSERGRLRQLVIDWLPFAVVLVAYDFTRGAADTLGSPVQVELPIVVDRFLFFGEVPTVWLQRHVYRDQEPAWWEVPVSLVYASHFVVPFAVAAWIWWKDRTEWLGYMRRFLIVTALGLLTYVALPTMPPWLASRSGALEGVGRTAARGWSLLGLPIAERVLEQGQATVNLVAALPSLHAAYAALVCVFLWRGRGVLARAVLLAYALSMGFVLVLTGEHYVLDILLGWAYVAIACLAASWWERRHARSRSAPTT